MALTALDRTSQVRSIKVTLSWTSGSETAYARWCEAGKQTDSLLFVPCIREVGDLVADNEGFSRWAFQVRTQGPFSIFHDLVAGTDYTEPFASLPAMIAGGYDPRFASVSVTEWATSGSDTQDGSIFSGIVSALSDMTALTTTIEMEQRTLEFVNVPNKIVTTDWWPTKDQQDTVPNESRGAALPLILGPHVPYNQFTQYLTGEQRRLGYYGFRPCVSPTLPVQRSQDNVYHVFEENPADNPYVISLPDATDRGAEVYISIPEADTFALAYNVGLTTDWDSNTNPWPGKAHGWRVRMKRRPWVTIPLRPRGYHSWTSTGVANPDFAVDGKYDTWATVPAGASLYFEVPSVSIGGRISTNTYDAGGNPQDGEYENAPAGLQIGLVLYKPPGLPSSGTGTVEYGLLFPTAAGESYYLFGQSKSVAPPGADGIVSRTVHPIPYYVDVTTLGWGGTKFHQWDFTTAPDNTGSDITLYDSHCAKKVLPFLMRVKNGCTGPVYVSAICWLVGCKLAVAASTPRTVMIFKGSKDGRYTEEYKVVNDSYFWATGVQRWLPGPFAGRYKPDDKEIPISPIYVSRDAIKDTAAGDFTGTAGKLIATPIEQAKAVLGIYGQVPTTGFVPETGGSGRWSSARALLAAWMNAAGAPTVEWSNDVELIQQGSLDAALNMIAEAVPGTIIRKGHDGLWRCFVWFPWAHASHAENYWRAGTRQLSFADLRKNAEGAVFYLDTTDRSKIYNSVEVAYDANRSDGRTTRIATCNQDGSDDGYGTDWPSTPGTGHTLTDLCAWSVERFGGPRKLPTIQVPGVRHPKIACAIGMAALFYNYRPRILLTTECLPGVYDLEPGMIFVVANDLATMGGFTAPFWGAGASWSGRYWRCTQAEQRRDDGGTYYAIKAEWYPRNVGDELGAFVGGEPGTDTML